jgi:hypothetical protein
MLLVTSFIMKILKCHIFLCNILITQDLGRTLESFTSCLAVKYGVNHENWLTYF